MVPLPRAAGRVTVHLFRRRASTSRLAAPAAKVRERRGLRHGRHAAVRRAAGFAVVCQHDREIIDVDRAVADEKSPCSNLARLPVVRNTMVKSLMLTLPSPLVSPGKTCVGARRGC